MGIIDPMAVTNGMATGVLEFGGAHTLWLALTALTAGAALAIALPLVRRVRGALPALPRLQRRLPASPGAARVK